MNEPAGDVNSHPLAFELLDHADGPAHPHVPLNPYRDPLVFDLSTMAMGRSWRRPIDAAIESPLDFSDPPSLLAGGQRRYTCEARPSVVLVSCPS